MRCGQWGTPPSLAAATDAAGGWRGAAWAGESAGRAGEVRGGLPPRLVPLRRSASSTSDAPAPVAPCVGESVRDCGDANGGEASAAVGSREGGGWVRTVLPTYGLRICRLRPSPLIWVGLLTVRVVPPHSWPRPLAVAWDHRQGSAPRPASLHAPRLNRHPTFKVDTQVASTFFASLSRGVGGGHRPQPSRGAGGAGAIRAPAGSLRLAHVFRILQLKREKLWDSNWFSLTTRLCP